MTVDASTSSTTANTLDPIWAAALAWVRDSSGQVTRSALDVQLKQLLTAANPGAASDFALEMEITERIGQIADELLDGGYLMELGPDVRLENRGLAAISPAHTGGKL